MKKQDKTNNKYKNYLLIVLAILSIFLIGGYAVFAQPLTFNTTFSNNENIWDIRFTSIDKKVVIGSAGELQAPNYNHTRATFKVLLKSPGDSITYDLTIKNAGTIDAKVDSINITPENKPNDLVWFTTDDIYVGDVLKANEEKHMTVTVRYNKAIESNIAYNKDCMILINFSQKS